MTDDSPPLPPYPPSQSSEQPAINVKLMACGAIMIATTNLLWALLDGGFGGGSYGRG